MSPTLMHLEEQDLSSEALNALGALMSAVATFAALSVAIVSHRQSRMVRTEAKKLMAHEMDARLQARLDPMYPGLRSTLGRLEDGVPREIREVLIPFFVLYGDAYSAYRAGILDKGDWRGLSLEFIYWSQRPQARRAWKAFRNQTWTDGFVEFVDAAMEGPPAYPGIDEACSLPPEIHWPPDQK